MINRRKFLKSAPSIALAPLLPTISPMPSTPTPTPWVPDPRLMRFVNLGPIVRVEGYHRWLPYSGSSIVRHLNEAQAKVNDRLKAVLDFDIKIESHEVKYGRGPDVVWIEEASTVPEIAWSQPSPKESWWEPHALVETDEVTSDWLNSGSTFPIG